MLRYSRKSRAEQSLKKKIPQETWDAVQVLKKDHGDKIPQWPKHWVSLMFPPITQDKVVDKPPKTRVKFREISDEDIQFVKDIYCADITVRERFNAMYERFGIESRTVGQWFRDLGLTNKREAEPEFLKEAANRELPTKKFVILTSAQSATPIHQGLWENIKAYAQHLDADIRVLNFRYKNPTSVHTDLTDDWWAPEIVPYLDTNKHWLSENLVVLGGLKIQPTAEFPLRGLSAISKGATAIIGHVKFHLESVPTLEGEHKQKLWTTGALTVENYTDSKAGARGHGNHSLGFVLVELDGDSFHVRQVPATDSGDFQDLNVVCSGGEVGFTDEVLSVVLGDLHHASMDAGKMNATVEMLHTLNPEYIILHDIFDGMSVNHHEAKNPIRAYHKIQSGQNLISTEINNMIEWLGWFSEEFNKATIVVVRSNHEEFLDRYILDRDWKTDVSNARYYAKCMEHLLSNPDTKGLIPYFIDEQEFSNVVCLTRDESYRPGTYQLANHGDCGVNGSKGSPLQYSKLNTKQITAHTHSPTRINGLLVTGTSSKLRPGYNIGPSSWAHADVVEYRNGKATHIIYDHNYNYTTIAAIL